MLTELRDWLMSAGEGWAGEGATYPPPFPTGTMKEGSLSRKGLASLL